MYILRQTSQNCQSLFKKICKIHSMERLDIPDDSWSKEAIESNALLEKFAQINNWERYALEKQTGDIRTYNRFGNEKIFYGSVFFSVQELKAKWSITYGPWSSNGTKFVHGGAIATHHDSITGILANKCFGACMTANLNVNFKCPLPVGSTFLYDCKVVKVEGRKIYLENKITSFKSDKVLGNASAIYVLVDKDASLTQNSLNLYYKSCAMIKLDVPEDSRSKKAVEFNKELEKFVEENNWTKVPINKQNDEIRHYAYCGNEKIFNGYLYVSAEERKAILLVTFGSWAYDHTLIYVDRGAVATLFDETIGTLAFTCSGGDCVTASLNVSFESPVLVGHPVIYRCQVEKIDKRKIFINSQITCVHDGKVLGRANAVFITKHLAASL